MSALALASDTLEHDPVDVYLSGLAPGSRRAQSGALERCAAFFGGTVTELRWHQLSYAHTRALATHLAETSAPATTTRILSALRGVLREAMRLQLMTAEECARACDTGRVTGTRLPAGREVERGELAALFDTLRAETAPRARRDAALLAVLYGAGLRRHELVMLDLPGDVDGTALRVHGKGNRERIAYMPAGAVCALAAWLEVRGLEEGPLFLPVLKGGRVTMRRLSEQTVFDTLRALAERAHVKSFSPHDMRRSFIGHLLDAGADISIVQKMAGHANVSTTTRYDRRPERAKERTAELLSIPL